MASIITALAYAAGKHAGQFRADGKTPYINHPIAIANILELHGYGNPDLLVAAVLHDVVEDTDATLHEIMMIFGVRAASYVGALTDPKDLSGDAKKEAQFQCIVNSSFSVQAIKLADKISNLTDALDSPPPQWSPEHRAKHFAHAGRLADWLVSYHPSLCHEIFKLVARERA